MVWNLKVGMEARYQEELPACRGSETWVSGGEGEKENLWTDLGIAIRGETFPALLPHFLSSLPPLLLSLQCYAMEKQ